MSQVPPEQVAVTPPVVPLLHAALQVVPLGREGMLLQLDGQPIELAGVGAVRGGQPTEHLQQSVGCRTYTEH